MAGGKQSPLLHRHLHLGRPAGSRRAFSQNAHPAARRASACSWQLGPSTSCQNDAWTQERAALCGPRQMSRAGEPTSGCTRHDRSHDRVGLAARGRPFHSRLGLRPPRRRWRPLLTAHLLLRGAYLSMATARDPTNYISRPRCGVVPPNPTWTLKATENRAEAAACSVSRPAGTRSVTPTSKLPPRVASNPTPPRDAIHGPGPRTRSPRGRAAKAAEGRRAIPAA